MRRAQGNPRRPVARPPPGSSPHRPLADAFPAFPSRRPSIKQAGSLHKNRPPFRAAAHACCAQHADPMCGSARMDPTRERRSVQDDCLPADAWRHAKKAILPGTGARYGSNSSVLAGSACRPSSRGAGRGRLDNGRGQGCRVDAGADGPRRRWTIGRRLESRLRGLACACGRCGGKASKHRIPAAASGLGISSARRGHSTDASHRPGVRGGARPASRDGVKDAEIALPHLPCVRYRTDTRAISA